MSAGSPAGSARSRDAGDGGPPGGEPLSPTVRELVEKCHDEMFPTDPLDELVISELRNHDIVSMRDLSMPPSEGLLKSPVWSLVELMQKKAAVQKFVDPGARSAKRARTAADAESGPGPRHGGPAPGVVQFCTARDARLDDIHLGDAVIRGSATGGPERRRRTR
ncbi:unnamed protein product [Prorocentrum cordatum]|uniref:Uncharacterized protein n=2 Tax=Prorocentrum cordatum TaxID=2364126 RepID=A0ABN9STS3_9DINO|nr:unnamed protein product [Polarella glacialis]CAK0835860.1 unnamed protein product [Polarella glacialis]